MKYHLRKAFFPFFYMIFMDIIAYSILTINDNLKWLKIILLILNLALYIFIVGSLSFKDGEDALNFRIRNDSIRKQMLKTGEIVKIDRTKEYKSYKGFITGAIVCIPLIIFIIGHTITLILGSSYTGFGTLCEISYFLIFAFYKLGNAELLASSYYFSLFAIPFLVLTVGIPYVIGGLRREYQQLKIEEQTKFLHGDDK